MAPVPPRPADVSGSGGTDLTTTRRPSARGVVGLSPETLPRRLRRIFALDDFEVAARRQLPRPIFGYVSGAAETGVSARDNRSAFEEWAFKPKVLVDVSSRDQRTEIVGQPCAAPFGIAPMGINALSAYRADLVMACAAERAGIPFVLSGSSLIPMEAVAAVAPSAWFQAYLPGVPERDAALVDRVGTAGFQTLVITVDTAVLANRENNRRAGFSTPLRPGLRLAWDGLVRPRWLIGTAMRTLLRDGMPHFENGAAGRGAPIVSRNVLREFGLRDHLDWSHLERVRRLWPARLVIKGLIDPDDVRKARNMGADGVIVSNHGGRQLDGALAPLHALPEAVDAAGTMPVMLDGGIRRGTDVLKAIALGAAFVFVGRPFVYAVAIGGELGVLHAIDILSEEIDRDLGLLGLTGLRELHPGVLVRRRP